MKRLIVTVLILTSLVAAASWTAVAFSTPNTAGAGEFVVHQGDSVRAVADRMEAEGVVRNARFFVWMTEDVGLEKTLQPGTYDLREAEDLRGIARVLASGGVAAREFTLLVREGENIAEIVAELDAAGYSQAEEFFSVAGSPPAVKGGSAMSTEIRAAYPFLAGLPKDATLEGYLFPDTYRVFRDATPEEIAQKLLDNFDRRVDADLRATLMRRGMTLHEAVTLASIVEREVRGDEDRAMVADLFLRRLGMGMALQADSTVNYATGKSLPSVTAQDLEVDSRYNTYKHRDLPPGPISGPGLSSLRAVAEPKANAYLYFLTDPQGTVYYARTFEEHGRNRINHLR